MVGLAIYFSYYASTDLQHLASTAASFVSESAPVASVAAVATEDEAHCAALPTNGAVVAGAMSQGYRGHRIDARNGAASPAIVKVRDASTGQLIVGVFVEPKGRVDLQPFPDGVYEIQFALGDALSPDCKSFSKPSFVGEFPLPAVLETEFSDGQLVTQRLSYILYSGASGELAPHAIDAAAFDAD